MLDQVTIWTALADPKRRQILALLEEKPRTTSELIQHFDVSRFAVMKHLKVLEQAGLIKSTRQGRTRWNYLHEDLRQLLGPRPASDASSDHLAELLGMLPGNRAGSPQEPAAAQGKQIEQRILLQAPRAQVFEAFTGGIDGWWHYRKSAANHVYLEPRVNGRFYEAFAATDEGILYGLVTYLKAGVELHLQGTFELSQQMANTFMGESHLCIAFEEQQGDTLLRLTHHIAGALEQGTAEILRASWRQLLDQHFQPFVEKGLPYQHYP